MFNIRKSTFETNSSSVNAVTLLTEDEYNKWRYGNYYLDFDNACVLSKETVDEIIKQMRDKWHNSYGDDYEKEDAYFLNRKKIFSVDSYDDYTDDYSYETDETIYTKDGKKFYLISYYGYD